MALITERPVKMKIQIHTKLIHIGSQDDSASREHRLLGGNCGGHLQLKRMIFVSFQLPKN